MLYQFEVKEEIKSCCTCPFFGIDSSETECCLLDVHLHDDYHEWYYDFDNPFIPEWCELKKIGQLQSVLIKAAEKYIEDYNDRFVNGSGGLVEPSGILPTAGAMVGDNRPGPNIYPHDAFLKPVIAINIDTGADSELIRESVRKKLLDRGILKGNQHE